MNRYEVICHAGRAILATVVEAADEAAAIRAAMPELRALARGRKIGAVRAVHI